MIRQRSTLLTILLALLCACDSGSTSPPPPPVVASVVISPQDPNLRVGESVQLLARAYDASGKLVSAGAASWTSSDSSLARVDQSGLLTARGEGRPTITASISGRAGQTSVSVRRPGFASITVTPAERRLYVNHSTALIAVVRDSSLTPRPEARPQWSSSDTLVLRVDSLGHVVAVSVGVAHVTASLPGLSAQARIEVALAPIATITIEADSFSVRFGDQLQLRAVLRDSAGFTLAGRAIRWGDGNWGVVKVDSTGVVTGLLVGTGDIAAVSEGKVAQVTLTVRRGEYTAISADFYASCAIAGSAKLSYCWGLLAAPFAHNSNKPRPTELSPAFDQISAGFYKTCGIAADYTTFCWGIHHHGLPLADTSYHYFPTLVENLRFKHIALDIAHGCGITADDRAYCWGANTWGMLGTGDTSDRNAPTPVVTSVRFRFIETGPNHSCGISTAGDAYCWGENSHGELGNNSTTNSLTPVLVAGGRKFSTVSIGQGFTCGLTTAGSGYCWGARGGNIRQADWGFLGTTAPAEICSIGGFLDPCNRTPVPVAGGRTFTALGTGLSSSCGLTQPGQVYCWGTGDHGQLGTDSPADSCEGRSIGCHLTPRLVPGTGVLRALSVGWEHVCGITAERRIVCWGDNEHFELGDPAQPRNVHRATPGFVADPSK